jgi:hypothetical protein
MNHRTLALATLLFAAATTLGPPSRSATLPPHPYLLSKPVIKTRPHL